MYRMWLDLLTVCGLEDFHSHCHDVLVASLPLPFSNCIFSDVDVVREVPLVLELLGDRNEFPIHSRDIQRQVRCMPVFQHSRLTKTRCDVINFLQQTIQQYQLFLLAVEPCPRETRVQRVQFRISDQMYLRLWSE